MQLKTFQSKLLTMAKVRIVSYSSACPWLLLLLLHVQAKGTRVKLVLRGARKVGGQRRTLDCIERKVVKSRLLAQRSAAPIRRSCAGHRVLRMLLVVDVRMVVVRHRPGHHRRVIGVQQDL